jgi:hypothetical protein
MSWLVVGTVPYDDFPLVERPCSLTNGKVRLGDERLPIVRGTLGLLAAATLAAEALGAEPPIALLAGDTGHGDGSKRVYARLVESMGTRDESLLIFHYLLPDLNWHMKILWKIEERTDTPTLVADAGYMYVAKMSGSAPSYDLFTPDVGEIAFLADELAPHPFYTRGFLLQEEERVPELILRAYEHENAARFLLVKGRSDYVASAQGILTTVSEPCVEAMEPIGGTGDSLTGIVAALLAAGKVLPDAVVLGAKINRMIGFFAQPTPAFSVSDLLPSLPKAIDRVLTE